MTDPNIVRFIDEHCVKNGDIKIKDIREYGEYAVVVPVYNESAEFAKEATSVLHLEFSRNGEDIVLHDFPKHLLTDDDIAKIQKAIFDFLCERELPAKLFREALFCRQQKPFERQNVYFAWKKPDDTFFMVGFESDEPYHILKYEYDSYCRSYGVIPYDINPYTAHLRGPQIFDPLEELVSKTGKYEYLGSWTDPEIYVEQENGLVAAHGRWDVAKAHICENVNISWKERVRMDIANAMRVANSFEEYKTIMENNGYSLHERNSEQHGRSITYITSNGNKVRDYTLGENSTYEYLITFLEMKNNSMQQNNRLVDLLAAAESKKEVGRDNEVDCSLDKGRSLDVER